MIQGMGGIMSITGQPDGAAGAGPVKIGVAFADIFTGIYSVIGMLAALVHRDRNGEGQHVDMALLDCQVAVLANQALNYLVGGKSPVRLGNAHPNIVPYQTFETKDGHIIIAVGTDRQFREYCTLIGTPALPDDPRFATNRARVENRDALIRSPDRADEGARPRRNGSHCSSRPPFPVARSTRLSRCSPTPRCKHVA